ncbi:4a-hydroxytetrahydrobiopterin dehydratase [Sphingomonas sp. BT-65]|uniref:4a-hydroxytetrahydrobiopterin dehydratase n=1 Tax=Sphingomonas sp. BT-65 TaxID=2989821 RepID=UPI002236B1DA|nr:4a-hydroxytetrahydrobiopterin dehydratase [Sphingomonas sp. BT-65]MCW4460911.1 4a-hydroxytetrahydrobiopterin dehydratase [Sphingomonas sp. BT-65]
MQLRSRVTPAEIAALAAWTVDPVRQALHRRLQFATFGEALGAMVRIGVEADKEDHHPEWSNVFGTIDIWLTTHDAGGISARDLALARTIDLMFPPKTVTAV